MKKLISLLLILSLIAISCTTMEQASTTKVMDIYGVGVIQYPVVGEMDVDINKVTGTVESSNASVNINSLKVSAVNNAIKKSNADILIEPIFDIVKDGRQTTVTVTGFPATYTNFRPITLADVPLLEAGQLQKADTYETSESVTESNNSNLIKFLGVFGGLGLVALIMSSQ